MLSMNHYIRKLPEDIISHIIGYTHQYQSLYLIEDIRNFHISKKEMTDLYRNYWCNYWQEDPPEERNWMVNDIVLFLHNDVKRYIKIMSRALVFDKEGNRLTSHYQLDQYRRQIDKKSINTEFNIYWGLLTPEERLDVYEDMKTTTMNNAVLYDRYLTMIYI